MKRLKTGACILGAFAFGLCWGVVVNPPPEEVEVVRERIVEVPVPGPTKLVEVQVPGPEKVIEKKVNVEARLPESCATMVDLVAGMSELNEDISAEASKVLPLLDGAVRDINDRDFKALNDAIQRARAIKNDLGTDQIAFDEAGTRFTNALERCRQEIAE